MARQKKREEYEPAVSNTSKSIVPRQKRSKHTKHTTRLLQVDSRSRGAIVGSVLCAKQEQEGQVQGEEEREEHDGGAQGAKQQDGGEDEPARQEEADGAVDVGAFVGVRDAEAGGEDQGVGDPETAVGREGSGTEGVTNGHFPIREVELVNCFPLLKLLFLRIQYSASSPCQAICRDSLSSE